MNELRQELFSQEPEAVLFTEELDPALIGIGGYHSGKLHGIYSRNKLIACLQDNNGWTYDEAVEYYEFNVECAYYGPYTPIIVKIEP